MYFYLKLNEMRKLKEKNRRETNYRYTALINVSKIKLVHCDDVVGFFI